jgi:hypothetical protein
MRRRLPAVLALALGLSGCLAPAAPAAPGPPAESPLTFFLLVNRSGRAVTVRAAADGRVLFVEALPARPDPAGGGVRPGSGPVPTRELKVPLAAGARSLTVEELNAGTMARVGLPLGPPQLGFRVRIEPDAIRVTRDYYPIR